MPSVNQLSLINVPSESDGAKEHVLLAGTAMTLSGLDTSVMVRQVVVSFLESTISSRKVLGVGENP